MTREHQITPPTELVLQWLGKHLGRRVEIGDVEQVLANKAARWGADQELEACDKALREIWQMDHVSTLDDFLRELRAARRPKPPTLKERGRKALQNIHNAIVMETGGRELDVLKEIVESLPD